MSPEQHLTESTLDARLNGTLPAEQRDAFDQHLLRCAPCQRKVSAWALGQRKTSSPWDSESVSSDDLQRSERLDLICDQFETQWRQGERPEVEAYAAMVPAPEQPALRCELLLLACQLDRFTARQEPAPPPVRRRTKPRSLGKYRLLKELARTGATAVHLAVDDATGQQVAIKRLRSRISLDAHDYQRLETLAQQAAGLRHPHLVTLHTLENSGGHHFWVMDYVEGESLTEQIKAGVAAEETACQMIAALAEAVEHAHQAGLVHGHLRPDKILVDGQGRPNLLGLGFPRHMPGSSELSVSQQLELLYYLAPEQLSRNRTAGPACDIYALGAVLYALLTGMPPFGTANLTELFHRLANEPPVPPSQHRGPIDPRLEAICLRCLEKDPTARFSSAQALAEELRTSGGQSPAQRRGSRLRRWWLNRWRGRGRGPGGPAR